MADTYNGLRLPTRGEKIKVAGGKFVIPDNPIIPYIEGDGTGRDIWKASVRVFEFGRMNCSIRWRPRASSS